ncbi:Conserved hypothetical protein [Mycoplasmopsis agalactiae]|uniref:Uncharacterized protein n=3 Tax=Bacteria TaxID=2 RepID=D3VQF7_MYCAA|nr:hypothetical protein E4L58_00165 [Mycoplasmopsis agalactiae]CBH40551.1 Conserved hypothetical protein [Mycoplasmopsis agalactiae]
MVMNVLQLFLWAIIALCFSAFVTFIAVLTYYKIRYINSINTNGVIFFKINLEKNNVIRLSSDNLSGLASFDDDKIGIKRNQTVDLSDFLSYFAPKSREKLAKYIFKEKLTSRYNLYCNLNIEKYANSTINKSYKHFNIHLGKKQFLVKLYPSADKKFIYCNIYWNFTPDYSDKNMFNALSEEYDILKLPNKYYLSYALTVNEFYLQNGLNNSEISHIIKMMDLTKHAGWHYFKDGILHLIIGTNSLLLLNKFTKNAIKKVNKVNLLNSFNPFFNSCALLSFKMPSEKEEITEYDIKAKYLLHHLDNNILNYKYYNWFYDNDSHLEHYSEFKTKLEAFETKNTLMEYAKDPIYVLNYNDGAQSNIRFLKSHILGFTNKDMDFFKNVPWHKFLYNNLWLEHLLSSETNSEDYVIVETNNINLDKVTKYLNENTILMLKYHYRDFNYELLSKLLNQLGNDKNLKKLSIGLYIDNLDEKLFNFIDFANINTFIFSKEICENVLKNAETYLKLQVFVQKISSMKKYLIIYENIPKNLENIVVQRLKIKYFYNV